MLDKRRHDLTALTWYRCLPACPLCVLAARMVEACSEQTVYVVDCPRGGCMLPAPEADWLCCQSWLIARFVRSSIRTFCALMSKFDMDSMTHRVLQFCAHSCHPRCSHCIRLHFSLKVKLGSRPILARTLQALRPSLS